MSPIKPEKKTFEELTDFVAKHLDPTPSAIVERFKFNSRFRKSGESMATFAAELRKMSQHCNFGDTLEDMLRDRSVVGIKDDAVQRRLLAEPNLTLQRAQEIALGMEMAAQNAKEIQQSETNPSVAGSVQYMKHRSARSYHQKPKRSDSTKNQSQANIRESKKCW